VTRSVSPRLSAYAALAALGLIAALALGRPELVAAAAPFALVLAWGLVLGERPRLELGVGLERGRALEGEELTATIRVRSETAVERLELFLSLPHGIELAAGDSPAAIHLPAGAQRDLELRLRCARWGGYVVGRVHVRARDRLGLFVDEGAFEQMHELRVYPREEQLRRLVAPLETQLFVGNAVSRSKGDGIEFADIRPYEPGDRVKRVNWRASARRGQLWVNETHPERNTDVILFLDSFTEARRGDASSLDMAVRAAASLATHYVGRRDRVGLVGFGGVLRWLVPGMGAPHLYRIVESLLDTAIVLNWAWKDIDIIPRRTLPPQALVLALTPLLDDRAVDALADLRARGFDVAVVEVSPVPFAAVPAPSDELASLAYRLWLLRRETLRSRYHQLGIAVAEWRYGVPLQAPLEEVSSFRRFARR
jgi:uncharacterized protein (DUF58 family)